MKKTLLSRIVKLELYVDSMKNFTYSGNMRWQAVTVLIALACTIAVPPSFSLVIGHDNQPVLGTLDVCHAGTPALASNGEMPCMNECTCGHIRTSSIAYTKQIDPLFSEFLLVTRHERPPQI